MDQALVVARPVRLNSAGVAVYPLTRQLSRTGREAQHVRNILATSPWYTASCRCYSDAYQPFPVPVSMDSVDVDTRRSRVIRRSNSWPKLAVPQRISPT